LNRQKNPFPLAAAELGISSSGKRIRTMLMVSLPLGDRSGTCNINAQKCEFKLTTSDDKLYFCFRPASEATTQWDIRKVVSVQPAGKGLATYICGDKDGAPITVFAPVLRTDEDGMVKVGVIS
jgi:hypothetical protein